MCVGVEMWGYMKGVRMCGLNVLGFGRDEFMKHILLSYDLNSPRFRIQR